MNISFEILEAQNFKSIGDPIYINYKDFSGLNFVIGNNVDNPGAKNGSGKSVILCDCLAFALFGRTLKQISNQYLSNRYYDKKKETYCKLTFSVNNNRYKTETYCNKSSIKMLLFKEDNNEECGWKDITQSTLLKTKQYIQDEILKCSFDIFKSAILISYSDCLNFYEGMTKSQKREYIENIFNLNCFGDMYDEIKSDLNNSKKEISFTNNEIIKYNQQLEDIKTKLTEYDEKLKNESDRLKNIILEEVSVYKKKQEEQKILSSDVEKFDKINSEYNNIKSEEDEINKNKLKLENEIFKAKTKIESINNLISEILNIKEGLCEKCSEIVNKRYDYEKQEKSIKILNDLIDTNEKKIIDINKNLNKTISNKTDLEQKMSSLSNIKLKNNTLIVEINSLLSNINKLKKEYKQSLENISNPFVDMLESMNKNLSESKNKLNELTITSKHLDILKDICSENGVKQFIIKDVVVLLNSLIQKYLNEIGAEYLVYFDESFDFKFITIDGECEFNSFSAGERQRIQIATLLAFRDLIVNGKINSNILIIDEVLDVAIDSIAIKKIINLLQKKIIDMNQSLFIISHRSEIADENIFNNIITIKKENGISSISIN